MKMRTLTEQLRHKPFPEVAQALRDRTSVILKNWRALVLQALPHIDQQTIVQFENDIREILALAANSLELDDEKGVKALFDTAPIHGLDRYLQKYELTDMLTEHRILRGVVIIEIENALGRPIKAPEAASIHAIIDVMFQQGTLMMVKKQQEQLRESAEAELKFLSYFSHDISNNLLVISSSLDRLNEELFKTSEFANQRELLDTARQTIRHTTEGMRRLLKHEQLRRAHKPSAINGVNLHEKFNTVARLFSEQAKAKGIHLNIQVDPTVTIETDSDLLYIILQNIVGNAVKHSDKGEVRITAKQEESDDHQRWRLTVADQGPGIDPQQQKSIFDAFEQGQALGVEGVGLGLAIASQAAKLLQADIEVQSQTQGSDSGTTFHILLPATPVMTA